MLNIPLDRIYATTLYFTSKGTYNGFDSNEPTSKDGGKAIALQSIQQQYGYRHMVMVGDGATDMQAKPAAELLIGYGRVVQRKEVQAQADWFITDYQELVDIKN